MQGRRTALIVRMDDDTREQLLSWVRATKTPVGLARRAWALLLLASGQSYAATARQVGMRERHVRKWAKRFLRAGPSGLRDAPRSGRPPVFSPRSRGASGQDRLRIARSPGGVAVPVGLPGIGLQTGGRRGGGAHFAADRRAHPEPSP